MEQGNELVRLLEEEVASLRKEGKRVAAESMEMVLLRFRVWQVNFGLEPNQADVVVFGPKKTEGPHEAASGIHLKAPTRSDLMLDVSLESIRCYVLRTEQDSFRVLEFSLSRAVDANGFSEVVGCGKAEVLGTSEEGNNNRAAIDLSKSLPSPIGYMRAMLDLELSSFGRESKIIRFKFRDVQIHKKFEPDNPSECPPPEHPDFPAWKQSLLWWQAVKPSLPRRGPPMMANSEQSGAEFVKSLAESLVRYMFACVWKEPSADGGTLSVRVLDLDDYRLHDSCSASPWYQLLKGGGPDSHILASQVEQIRRES